MRADSADGASYTSIVPSLLLTASLAQVPSSALFIEEAEFTNPLGTGTPPRFQTLAGITHDIGPHVQIDLEAGRSPTAATGAYHYLGGGLTLFV